MHLRAILVSVDYADLLAITLPRNRHHFAEVMVVTDHRDQASAEIARENGSMLHRTDAFYHRGASFNKWAALEEGLSAYGRHGMLCIMDADILWPEVIPAWEPQPNCLYTPLRRMWEKPSAEVPSDWRLMPLHPQQHEWAGYTQIFSADDPVLGNPPWHDVDWRHAGGADSLFQARWKDRKLRPPFEVLHLGPAGVNWCGRSSPYLDGSSHPQAQERYHQLRLWIAARRKSGFSLEKL